MMTEIEIIVYELFEVKPIKVIRESLLTPYGLAKEVVKAIKDREKDVELRIENLKTAQRYGMRISKEFIKDYGMEEDGPLVREIQDGIEKVDTWRLPKPTDLPKW